MFIDRPRSVCYTNGQNNGSGVTIIMIKLLLIEDDQPLNESICFYFAEEGFAADGALCAEEAFRLMENRRYDIVITDVMLPQMDGFETARLLRVFDPSLPIIFLTALDDIGSKEKGYGIGIDSLANARPGDLICFYGHVGIYIGDGMMVHAESIPVILEKTQGLLPIIAIAEISKPERAAQMLDTGADLIAVSNSPFHYGPALIKRINKYLDKR